MESTNDHGKELKKCNIFLMLQWTAQTTWQLNTMILKKRFGRSDLIPLWIADMDLPVAQPIVDAMEKRNQQLMYGYTTRPDSYFEAVCRWEEDVHGWKVSPAVCSFNVGVVPAMAALVQQLSEPGDQILFQTPVYPAFFSVVKDWGRVPLLNPLKQENGRYVTDYALLEEQLKQKPALFLLCSPHNPVGRVWSRAELERLGELCLRYGVTIVSDEIHADLLLWGNRHIPIASISPELAANTITCISATKTFNLAGLQASTTIYPNQEWKNQMDSWWNRMDISRNNCFSAVAVEAAYRYGRDWLDQAIAHFQRNMIYIRDFLQANIPEITTFLPESTYLMWLDCRGLRLSGDDAVKFMIEKAGLALNDGRTFGGEAGFFRLNVACPLGTLERAMKQLREAVSSIR